jgi:hypothetical protein
MLPDGGALPASCDHRHSDLRSDVLIVACPKHAAWRGAIGMIHRQQPQCWRRIETLTSLADALHLARRLGLRKGYSNDNGKSFSCLSFYGETWRKRDASASGSIYHVA